MGEIADALRRARLRRRTDEPERELEVDSAPDEAAVEAVASRAREQLADEGLPPQRISREADATWPARVVLIDGRGVAGECYRHFALKVRHAMERRSARSVLVAGPLRGEGKTTTACNLALALASIGAPRGVALVDLDLRRPRVATSLGLEPRVGVEEVLAGDGPLSAARIRTDLEGFDVYAVRRSVRDAERLLSGPALVKMLQRLEAHYEIVVIDTAPLLLVGDAVLVARRAAAHVLVARAGMTQMRSLRDALGTLPPGRLIGTFLNQGTPPPYRRQYGYYLDREE